MATAKPLEYWTLARIDAECRAAHSAYDKEAERWYTEYFADSPHRHPLQAWSAKNIACALPPRWEELADLISKGRHDDHLSGKSSQLLALALFGASASLDPSHGWLWKALGLPDPPSRRHRPKGTFEYEVDRDVLNETSGKRTSVDYFIRHPENGTTVCIECKWREDGLGKCGCADRDGCDPTTGACYEVMRDQRPALWEALTERFGLPARADGRPCPLHPVYQAVRNAAAAMKLREGGGLGVFVLVYDANNPYFAGHGGWPGWATVLTEAVPDLHPDLRVRAVSWQDLMAHLVLDDATRDWAREKHRLP